MDSKKEIDMAIFKSVSGSLIIIIENTIIDESLNIERIFEEGFSTKGSNRGKGLSTVKSIINSYQNVTLNTNIANGLFTLVIE